MVSSAAPRWTKPDKVEHDCKDLRGATTRVVARGGDGWRQEGDSWPQRWQKGSLVVRTPQRNWAYYVVERETDPTDSLWGTASQDCGGLQRASWRPSIVSAMVQAQMLETQEEMMFQCESKARRNQCLSSKTVRQQGCLSLAILFRPDKLIGWDPSILGRTIYFAKSTGSNGDLIQNHPHRHTQNNVSPNIWSHLAQSSWHIKWMLQRDKAKFECRYICVREQTWGDIGPLLSNVYSSN
jgi:hypothetical protein